MHTNGEGSKDAFGGRTENVVSRDGRTVTVGLARGDVDACLRDDLDEMLQCIRAGRNHPDTNYYLPQVLDDRASSTAPC